MSNITQRIDNFVEGISQQPPTLRHPEQLEEQLNGFSTEAGGLQKRPPTLSIAKLFTGVTNNYDRYLTHLINRDEEEKYIVFIDVIDKTIRVFDLEGKEYTVHNTDAEYLSGITKNPYGQLKVVTVADYTFILNKTRKVQMSGQLTEDTMDSQGALVNVKQGQYGRTYRVYINGVEVAVFETPDGSRVEHIKQIATDYIRGQLAGQIRNKGYEVDEGSSWLRVRGHIDKIETADSFNNLALIGTTSYVNKFTSLPASAPDGYTVLVRGESNADDNYYVRYSTAQNIWVETVKTGLDNTIDAKTMPHVLTRDADGSFTFKPLEWEKRKTGDEESNEIPSFVGSTINDLFFYRNRLGFLSGENIILSSSSNLFNFWLQSVADVQDDDTIDTNAPNNKVSILYNAIPFSGSLYVFSGQTQFSLDTEGNTLTPKNAKLDSITEFDSDISVSPVGAGNSVYFVSKRADFASVQEYRIAQYYTDVKDAEEVTAHVPYYIPNSVYKIVGNSSEKIVFVLTDKEPYTLYVYKYLYLNGRRVQSAWSKWEFTGKVLGVDFIGSTMYLAVQYTEGDIFLESLTLSHDIKDFVDIEPYRIMLDRKKVINVVDQDDNYYYISPEQVYGDKDSRIQVVTRTGVEYVMNAGVDRIKIPKSNITKDDLTNEGILQVIVGVPYTFLITFSPFYLKKTDDSGGTITLPSYRLIIRTVFLDYANTGYIKARVGEKYEYVQTNKKMGKYSLGNRGLISSGTFRIPIRKKNTETQLQVINDTPLPLSITGGGYEANYTTRFKNI